MKKNCPFVVPEKSLNVGAEEREEKKHLSLSLSPLLLGSFDEDGMLVPALAEHSTTLSFQRKQHSSDIKSGFLLTFPIKSNDLNVFSLPLQ